LSIDSDNMPDFLRARLDLQFPLGFASRAGGFAEWRTAGLSALRAAIGPALDGEASVEVTARQETPRQTRLRLRVAFPTEAATEALMLLPTGSGPHPAVLLLHDHGSEFAIGKEKLVAPWDDARGATLAEVWARRFYGGALVGEALAQRGYAVLAADALGWGSRKGNGYDSQQALAANLMQSGLTLAGLVAAEDAQLAAWLGRHPLIDETRVGAFGFSFGGYRAWQVAALCPEIRAAASVAWMGRLRGLMRSGNNQLRGQSAFYMLHPALGGKLDYPDVAGLAAPKPMQFIAGRRDAHFPPAAAMAAFADLRRI